jgi:hypothetical protein
VSSTADLRADRKPQDSEPDAVQAAVTPRPHQLSALQCAAGFLVFVAWLGLFGAGIMVDTSPYRIAISSEGARQLRVEGQPASGEQAGAQGPPAVQTESQTVPPPARTPGLPQSWLVVLLCFLPLNLAWLCVSASTLGAMGNLANLGDDRDSRGFPDASNPLMSAILRGFFVYLFLMSGLLLLDHAPFSNAGPSQYIRLAGFLSLFSFVVSYHPHLFGALIVSAFERIQVRAGDGNGAGGSATNVQQHTSIKTVEMESTSIAKGPNEPASDS